jgi:hypothetical protein
MADDTLTFALQGDVSLDQFDRGIRDFTRLVAALSDVADAKGMRWQIDQLAASSAICTVRGISENGYRAEAVEEVTRDYLEVGRALEKGAEIPFPPAVTEPANDLVALIKTGVEAVRFETAVDDAFISEATAARELIQPVRTGGRRKALGVVTGQIQTLSNRGSLRFVVYDRFFDKAVSCYLAEGDEEMIRDAWGRVAAVRGEVSRDPKSGRPLTVRKISKVELLETAGQLDFRHARGALPRREGSARPEQRIRRLRDA